MPRPAASFPPPWTARPLFGSAAFLPTVSLSDLGPDWRELEQAWLPARQPGFNRGWARIRWNADGLLFEILCTQTRPSNRARVLNEPTWEMGDVGEFFLQENQTGRYLELHVTPENQRLQLLWPPGGIEKVRAGQASLADFLVPDPNWVESAAGIFEEYWAARAFVPFACLGLAGPEKLPKLRTAVCRYDRSLGPELLSSTANLTAPNFHRYEEWADLILER